MNNFTFSCITAAALTILFTSCSKQDTGIEPTPRPVIAFTVEAPISSVERSFSGRIKSSDTAALAFEVSGRITFLDVVVGKSYREGDLLAAIETTDYDIRLNDAQSTFDVTNKELQRIQRLFETGNASQSQLEAAIRNEKNAKAALDIAQRQLDQTELFMPYDGIIGSLEVDIQELVSAGAPIVKIQGEALKEFEFGVPTKVNQQLQVGLPLTIVIREVAQGNLAATIVEQSKISNADGSFTISARLNEFNDTLLDGMDGEAKVILDSTAEPYFAVPIQAVSGGPNGNFLWKLTPNKNNTATVNHAPVTTGNLLENGFIAITQGLAENDIVVARGVSQMVEGMVVSFKSY